VLVRGVRYRRVPSTARFTATLRALRHHFVSQCGGTYCSRYVLGHMVAHWEGTLMAEPDMSHGGHCMVGPPARSPRRPTVQTSQRCRSSPPLHAFVLLTGPRTSRHGAMAQRCASRISTSLNGSSPWPFLLWGHPYCRFSACPT
jgi:hypothetical protein